MLTGRGAAVFAVVRRGETASVGCMDQPWQARACNGTLEPEKSGSGDRALHATDPV